MVFEACSARQKWRRLPPQALGFSGFVLIDGEGEMNFCPANGSLFDPKLSAVSRNERPANRQSHSHATRFRRVEGIEHPSRRFRREAGAVVGNDDLDFFVAR